MLRVKLSSYSIGDQNGKNTGIVRIQVQALIRGRSRVFLYNRTLLLCTSVFHSVRPSFVLLSLKREIINLDLDSDTVQVIGMNE